MKKISTNETKTVIMNDACYLVKKGDDLRDVEMFLEACSTVIKNKISNSGEDLGNLVLLKHIDNDLYILRDGIKNLISIKMKPTITFKTPGSDFHDNDFHCKGY